MERKKLVNLVVLFSTLYISYTLTKSLVALYQAKDRVTTQQEKLTELKNENQVLSEKLEEVSSVEFVEKEAREKLNMQLPGEVVVLVDEAANKRIGDSSKKDRNEGVFSKWLGLIFY